MSALCKKGSPHAKPCGEVEIFGLPIKCWKLRWFFINCNKSWWDDPSTNEECILTARLIYNNVFAWFFVLNRVENDFEHNFSHPFKFCGSPRISYHTESKIFVPNLHRTQFINDEWCNNDVVISCHYRIFFMFRVRIWSPLQADASPTILFWTRLGMFHHQFHIFWAIIRNNYWETWQYVYCWTFID